MPDAGQPRASCVGREQRPRRHLQPGWRAPAPQRGSVQPAAPGPEGQETVRVRTAAGPRQDGGKPLWTREPARRMQPAARQDAGRLRGPQWAPPPARAHQTRCSNFTWPWGCGGPARAGPPPGQPRGPEPRREGVGTGEPGRPQPALTGPRCRRRRRGCTPSSMVPPRRGHPVPPPHTTPHAAAPTTPPPARPRPQPRPLSAGGRAGAGGGPSAGSTNQGPLSGPLHQDWRVPHPMGKRLERGASAPRGGGLRRR